MALGTIDRTPPPFFRQGVSARTKLVFFTAAAVFLMVADTRWSVVTPLRAVVATGLLPLQRALSVPGVAVHEMSVHWQGLREARAAEAAARQALAAQSQRAERGELLAQENERLRALLELRPSLPVPGLAAEVLHEAADPYSRKLVIDRGSARGVVPGSPVVNEAGVLGQVTRVYPLSAEVTLLVDKDAAIPVLNQRTQTRSAAFGTGQSTTPMELRFMAANADVQQGDLLSTSGVDGIYPPGLPVARVVKIERQAEGGFARVSLQPAAPSDAVHHVLVLEPLQQARERRDAQAKPETTTGVAR